ncbi:hypothetical protein PRZ48_004806 [Zasmidium cellare]|uniref:Protein kinase domain-containing protein n=1 Tax=Zasmidium cellare TaxID=395010 RepID=A0ABR0ERL6_ZASCE|nr:hypothetical protein PRZ48_004806 [Zasmidium cellare]
MAQPDEIWMALEQAATVRYRNYFNDDIPAADRTTLMALLPEYAQIETARQQREDNPLQNPDPSDAAEVNVFNTQAELRGNVIENEMQCLDDIAEIGARRFLHRQALDPLNELRATLQEERDLLQEQVDDFEDRSRAPPPADVEDGPADGEVPPARGSGDAQDGAAAQDADPVGNIMDQAQQFLDALAEENRRKNRDRRHRLGQLNEGWWKAKYLGAGTYGKTWAWIKQNEHGLIIDRLVIKDARASQGARHWDPSGQIPME